MDDDEALAMVTRIFGPMRRVEADVPYRIRRMDEQAVKAAATPPNPPSYAQAQEMPDV